MVAAPGVDMPYQVGLDDLEINMGKNVILHNATVPKTDKTPKMRGNIVIPIDILVNFLKFSKKLIRIYLSFL